LLDVSPKSLSFDRSLVTKKRAKAQSELVNSEIKHLRAHLQAKASDKKQHSMSQSSKTEIETQSLLKILGLVLAFDKQASKQGRKQ